MPRILRLLFTLALCSLPVLVRAQESRFTVGTASAKPGEKATGYLDVPAGSDAGTQRLDFLLRVGLGEQPLSVRALLEIGNTLDIEVKVVPVEDGVGQVRAGVIRLTIRNRMQRI